MGLFGGSKSQSEQTIITETTTSTRMRDVGLTGQHAVNLATVIEQGASDREALRSDTILGIAQLSGANFNQLVGGAGVLTQTSADTGANIIDASDRFSARSFDFADRSDERAFKEGRDIRATGMNFANRLVNSGQESARIAVQAAQGRAPTGDQLTKMLPLVGVGIAGLALLAFIFKKGK